MEFERHGGKRVLPKLRCGKKPVSTKITPEGHSLLTAALNAWEKREGIYRPSQWDLFKAERARNRPNGMQKCKKTRIPA